MRKLGEGSNDGGDGVHSSLGVTVKEETVRGRGGVHGRRQPRTDAFLAGAEEKDQEEEAMSVSDVEEDAVTVVDGEEEEDAAPAKDDDREKESVQVVVLFLLFLLPSNSHILFHSSLALLTPSSLWPRPEPLLFLGRVLVHRCHGRLRKKGIQAGPGERAGGGGATSVVNVEEDGEEEEDVCGQCFR